MTHVYTSSLQHIASMSAFNFGELKTLTVTSEHEPHSDLFCAIAQMMHRNPDLRSILFDCKYAEMLKWKWSLVDFICDAFSPNKPIFVWPNLSHLVLRFWKGKLWQSTEEVALLVRFLVAHPKLETLVLQETYIEDTEDQTAKPFSLAVHPDSLPALKRLLGSPRLIAGVLESRAACSSVERVIDNSEEGFDSEVKVPYIDRILDALENVPDNQIQRLRLEIPQLNRNLYSRIAQLAPKIRFLEFLRSFELDSTSPKDNGFDPLIDIPSGLNEFPNLKIIGRHIAKDFARAFGGHEHDGITELARQVPRIAAVHALSGNVMPIHRHSSGEVSIADSPRFLDNADYDWITFAVDWRHRVISQRQLKGLRAALGTHTITLRMEVSCYSLKTYYLRRVHASLIKAESQVFEDMFAMPDGDGTRSDGASDQRPVVIPQVEPGQFRNLMKMFYCPPSSRFFVSLGGGDPTNAVQWDNFKFYLDIASLSHRFAMSEMEEWAKNQFSQLISSWGEAIISRPQWGHPAVLALLEAIEYAQIIQDWPMSGDLKNILQYYLSRSDYTELPELFKVFRMPDLRIKHPSIFGCVFILFLRESREVWRGGDFTKTDRIALYSELVDLIPLPESFKKSVRSPLFNKPDDLDNFRKHFLPTPSSPTLPDPCRNGCDQVMMNFWLEEFGDDYYKEISSDSVSGPPSWLAFIHNCRLNWAKKARQKLQCGKCRQCYVRYIEQLDKDLELLFARVGNYYREIE
ncbi:unnamed protein product [Rhizoctonia solani]|uniref:BTB domain-containing protein n=1 Tax=Rhizoctonia solani TaxID=456999 RepID=A0A8H3E073_9AGAM|nr:unnamed protein product [Rhizoctonia solani]